MKETHKGILTIATGAQKYIDMAINLSLSSRLKVPHIPIALVTDSKDPELHKHFNFIIPVNSEYGKGVIQKLFVNEYSPFEKTMFIDSDCLIVDSIDWLFDLFDGKKVSVIGKKKYDYILSGKTIEYLKTQIDLDYLISFNGGVYYFEKSELANKVYEKAREFVNYYDKLGFRKWRDGVADEVLMSLAMSYFRMIPIEDGGKGMRTPIAQKGQFKMDILKGYCEFYKEGEKVTPAIMHFGGDCLNTFFYKRELKKMKLAKKKILPKSVISLFVNIIYNSSYILQVFVYRVVKSILKGAKFKFTPLMPMYRFE